MEKVILRKGNCGNKAIYKGWCAIKWKKGNKVCVTCPKLEEKRANSISEYRIKEAKLGFNPMQNPRICKKNHSLKRNKKASKTLKELGRLKLLPQQIESQELRENRLRKIRRVLKKLAAEGKLNHQMESRRKKLLRHKKISNTLIRLGRQHKLPMQNMTLEERIKFGKKISRTLRKKIKSGEIQFNTWGRIYEYNSLSGGKIKVRSKWERKVAKFLDKSNIKWEYEAFAISYFDKERSKFRYTIPDFYIKNYNLFIEVKGNGEFRKQNTIDKIKGIRKKGYRAMLFGREQIKLIKENPEKLVIKIKGAI